jgi:energy-coupling factor transporter ATP-binding protein EcfA2
MNEPLKNSKMSIRFEEICRERIPGFLIDEYNYEVIDNLKKYIDRDPSGAFNINKGIGFTGNPGSGKTELLRSMQKVYYEFNHPLTFGFAIVWQIAEDFSQTGFDVLNKFNKGHWLLDELGRREKEMTGWMHTKVDMADVLIQRRYKLFKDFQLLMHFTSNLSKKQLEKALDWATFSRLNEMTNFVGLVGPDRRKNSQLKSVYTEKTKAEVSTNEKNKIKKKFIIDRIILPWKEYIETNNLNLPIAEFYIYDILDELKIIQISDNRKKEIAIQAKSIVKEKNWRDPAFRLLWELNDPVITKKIVIESKRIALREFFAECKEKGEKLDELIMKKIKKL